jgi:hypothetical protein
MLLQMELFDVSLVVWDIIIEPGKEDKDAGLLK